MTVGDFFLCRVEGSDFVSLELFFGNSFVIVRKICYNRLLITRARTFRT